MSHHRFRVLALSATPGKDLESVQGVINNLLIAHMEVRHPDDPDVKKHSFVTLEDVRVVKESPVTKQVVQQTNALMRSSITVLNQNKILIGGSEPERVTAMLCVNATKAVMANKVRYGDKVFTIIDHAMLLGRLVRCRNMLKNYGLFSLTAELERLKEGTYVPCARAAAAAVVVIVVVAVRCRCFRCRFGPCSLPASSPFPPTHPPTQQTQPLDPPTQQTQPLAQQTRDERERQAQQRDEGDDPEGGVRQARVSDFEASLCASRRRALCAAPPPSRCNNRQQL